KVYLSYTNNQGCTNRDSMVMTITEPCIKNTENIFIQPEAEQVLKNVPVYFSINALENEFGYEWELPLGCKAFTGVNASRIGLIFSEPESEIAVKITNTCGDTLCKKMVVRLAEQSNILFDVHFYPVPAKDFLTIQLTGIEESTETIFKISDCNGKQIYILKTDHLFENIDLRGLASGLYSLEVQHGTSFKRHRFIKL
nr:T9SS type A sorting domain-containing protein [Bacteroidia bacterium]